MYVCTPASSPCGAFNLPANVHVEQPSAHPSARAAGGSDYSLDELARLALYASRSASRMLGRRRRAIKIASIRFAANTRRSHPFVKCKAPVHLEQEEMALDNPESHAARIPKARRWHSGPLRRPRDRRIFHRVVQFRSSRPFPR